MLLVALLQFVVGGCVVSVYDFDIIVVGAAGDRASCVAVLDIAADGAMGS